MKLGFANIPATKIIRPTAGIRNTVAIYAVLCEPDSRVYIGQSRHLGSRVSSHQTMFRKGWHTNPDVLKAFQKYGRSAFSFWIIERCSLKSMLLREHHFIKLTRSDEKKYGFNLDLLVPNKTHHQDTKDRIGNAHRGKTIPKHAFEANRKATLYTRLGPHSERNSRISAALLGRKMTEAQKARLRRARARKDWSKCVSGHPLTKENAYYMTNGKGPYCRKCRAAAKRRWKAKKMKSSPSV